MPEQPHSKAAFDRSALLAALDGWAGRDSDGSPPCSVERGTLVGGDLEVIAGGLTYEQADAIESALYTAWAVLEVFGG